MLGELSDFAHDSVDAGAGDNCLPAALHDPRRVEGHVPREHGVVVRTVYIPLLQRGRTIFSVIWGPNS